MADNLITPRMLNFGFSDIVVQQAACNPGFYLGRVSAQSRDIYKIITEKSELLAEISGKMRRACVGPVDFPAVGDFVIVDRDDDRHGTAIIHQILPRKTVFIRKAAGTGHTSQVVAANIDTVFICMSLNNNFNLRRLERYLAISWDSGSTPVIVLTKSDLSGDLGTRLNDIHQSAMGVDVVVTSGLTTDGTTAIRKYLKPGETIAFLGSSGVGKSTLINQLLGENLLHTREIRKDDRGRHATTTRELLALPNGSAVIDTPGMRELGLEQGDISRTFAEIDELANACRFSDCRHEQEPDCAVRKAVEEGVISEERLLSYKKLSKEAVYEGLNSRQIEKEKFNAMFSSFGGAKNARDYVKSRKK